MISNPDSDTFYVGGMDISFVKGDDVNACAALVVFSFPDLEVKLSIFVIYIYSNIVSINLYITQWTLKLSLKML